MANIFENINTTVVPGYKPKETSRKIDVMSDQVAAKMYLRRRELDEQRRQEEIVQEALEIQAEKRATQNEMLKHQIMKSRAENAMIEFPSVAKTELFKKILTECYVESLIFPPVFVKEHMGSFTRTISDYVDSKGGFKLLENTVNSTGSHYLKKMKTVCEKMANEICNRKLKESKDAGTVTKINFDMTSDEEKSFDSKKTEIPPDEIADLVRKKVLTVVKDEKERQTKEDELKADIEKELMDSEEVTDVETAKEAVNNIFVQRSVIEHTTLFSALLRNSCNSVIIESASADNELRDVDTTEDDISNYAPGSDDTINGDAMDSDRVSYDSGDSDSEVRKGAIPMEVAMYESIAQYTLMEMLYTMKFEDYGYDDIRRLSDKLIRPIRR